MTRESVREYAAALRGRYRRASKGEKGKLLDAFCMATGYHRTAAARLLATTPAAGRGRGGRPARYDVATRAAWRATWEATGRMCGKRLAPFLEEVVPLLERHGDLALADETRARLLEMSAATIDRLTAPERRRSGRRPATATPAGAALRAQIPLRTFDEWAGAEPGAMQADLVAHCGESTAGFYLTTLTLVDVATGWTELEAIWGKGQEWVAGGVRRIRERLPFALRELHTDNGGEFVNHLLYPWCQREGIRLTRGRPYRKNDQAWVEQRNWQVVRRLVGYDRYATHAAHARLGRLYETVPAYLNFLQPIRKLTGKERDGAKVIKRYDPARTPYRRLLLADILTPTQRERLERFHQRLDPSAVRARIDADLAALWQLAEPLPRRPAPPLSSPQQPPF